MTEVGGRSKGAIVEPVARFVRRVWSKLNFELGRRYHGIEAKRYDRRLGVNTSGKASMRQMGIDGAIAEHGTGFQSINERHLSEVLTDMAFPADAGFVDIGSGKGKALFIAAGLGFRPVVGVEVVQELCTITESNLRTLALDDVVKVLCVDGSSYAFGDERVILLNNPFDASFLAGMVDVAAQAFRQRGGPAWILYGNPAWRHVLDDHPNWVARREFHFWGPGRDIVVFEFRDGE